MPDANTPTRPDGPLWAAMRRERPLQIAGAVNAWFAMLAEDAGFTAIYLSGSGVATASYGLPDLGVTQLDHVVEDLHRIAGASTLPLLVDVDTGREQASGIAETAKQIIAAGAAGMHIEDQVAAKRCGHREGKMLVTPQHMAERIATAVEARTDAGFAIMARTDAAQVEGVSAAVDRAGRYIEAGADMIFAEALESVDEIRRFTSALDAPVMINLTEFGRTPLFSLAELREASVALVLYPLSAFHAASAGARRVYETIRREGSQKSVIDIMQTRDEMYRVLRYEKHEQQADRILQARPASPDDS